MNECQGCRPGNAQSVDEDAFDPRAAGPLLLPPACAAPPTAGLQLAPAMRAVVQTIQMVVDPFFGDPSAGCNATDSYA